MEMYVSCVHDVLLFNDVDLCFQNNSRPGELVRKTLRVRRLEAPILGITEFM